MELGLLWSDVCFLKVGGWWVDLEEDAGFKAMHVDCSVNMGWL